MCCYVLARSSNMATDPSFGKRIRRARERLRMSQEQLATALGVSRSAVNNWEMGHRRPRSSTGAIEHVLKIDLSQPDDPPPDLIRKYGHIPWVAKIWAIPDDEMGEQQKLGVIRYGLREHPPADPRRETA